MKDKLKLLIPVWLFTVLAAGASEPVYAGYYRGATRTNSSGVVIKSGLCSFTNITNAVESARQIGTQPWPSVNWQKVAFDGTEHITFERNYSVAAAPAGPGLYKTLSLISSNFDSGVVYTFTNWHGIGYCSPFFYGLYNGTAMSGPGLYRFSDPTDPESAATRLFAPQTFPSNTWNDMDFDGTRWLFVRTAAAGSPGIYQFDPQTTSFTCISGTETYTNWDGLGVYVAPEPPPPPTNIPLLHKKIYVILFGGQSNALGWGYQQYLQDTGNPLAEPQPDVDFYVGNAGWLPINTLSPLQSGAGNPSVKTNGVFQYPTLTNAPVNRFGPELSMGRTVRDLIRIPNSKIAVIKYAVGGTSLYSRWLPDGTTNSTTDGSTYQEFQTTVWKGLAALQTQYPDYEIEILGMGWVQGEADAKAGIDINYFSNLTNFVADVRATFGSNIVFALSKLSPNQSTSTNYTTVRAAQQAAADTVYKVGATETIGTNYLTAAGYNEGGVHYLTPSLLQIGRDLGNAIVSASGLDADHDGLPDAWENSYAPGAAGLGISPDSDYDHDGLTDLQEFQTGTDPTNLNDRLNLTSTQRLTRWLAKKDIRYQMRTSTNLTAWINFGDPIVLRSSNSPIEVDLSQYLATNHSVFFRLHVL
jgi:hypothetical protein